MAKTITRQAKASKDVKVSLKRKDKDDSLDMEYTSKKQKNALVRSRINADKEFWDKMPILKQDCRTAGVIPRLEPNFRKADTLSAYLCSPLTDHLSTGFMDLGWGCGYRNCQMLMTFLERQKQEGEPLLKSVLDIPGIQLLIEKAWQEGFDTLGAAQLDHHVFKTRKWIGTTEVYTLLAYLGIRSTIIDFHQPGPQQLHHELMDWIQSYFMDSAAHRKSTKTVCITNRPPLYLQHQGHSRTVVGIELLKSGKRNLIMFDPGRRILRSYRSSQNVLESEEPDEHINDEENENKINDDDEELDILNHDDKNDISISKRFLSRLKHAAPLPSSLLRPFRVDDKSIGKHKQYQVLVLGQVDYRNGKMAWDANKGYLLSEDEREKMKNVTSLAVM
ncbi:peptidase family C78-domain-containing protein [Parasitella parasitica]|nr:peptidase family C78-domain-containing protein [Parasitella parasitica]